MKSQKIKLGIAIAFCGLGGLAAGSFFQSAFAGAATFGGLVAIGMVKREESALFMATPDTSALGAYAGKYELALFSTLREKLSILTDYTPVFGVKNTIKLTKLTVKDGIRGYREDFDSADDDLSYSGTDLSTTLLKRDLKINPLKYRSTWMSLVMKPGVNVDDLPFAKYTNEAIMAQIAQEVQRGLYYAVKGDESTLVKCFDGPGTLIAKAITAETNAAGTGLTPVATGAITNTNAVSKFELMVSSLPTEYIENGCEIDASIDNVRKFQEDYRERYGKYKEKDEKGQLVVNDTGGLVVIKPRGWMKTSGRLIATPAENKLVGVDGLGDMDKIITDYELEIIKYRILFAMGFQFRDLKAMRVNDQV
jgi:hypothetical protein